MGHRPTKILFAVTTNRAALNLDDRTVRHLLVGHHCWTPDGKTHIVVAETFAWRDAQQHFTTAGAVVAPPVNDHATPVGAAFAALIPASHGVVASDTCWQAMEKISQGAGWPHADPAEIW